MPLTSDHEDWRSRVLERAKELAHAHRLLAASSWPSSAASLLSLRFLRTWARRLVTKPALTWARSVPHPAAGQVALTFVGHATVMLTTPQTRVLTDPFLGDFLLGLRRARAASWFPPRDVAETGLILVSHAHRDRLDVASLARLPRRATLVVPPRCADLVRQLGFARLVELAPGQQLTHADVEVTAVAACHDGSRGLWDRVWRAAVGYIVRSEGANLYFAGGTGYFSGFEEIGQRLQPDVALLPISGYQPLGLREHNMSPLDAVQAFCDLGAQLLVPVAYGSFPLSYEPLDEPLSWLTRLCQERGLADRLAVLSHGETCLVRARASDKPTPAIASRAHGP